MLGLVDYSESDDEHMEQQDPQKKAARQVTAPAAAPASSSGGAAAAAAGGGTQSAGQPPRASGLPSAAELLDAGPSRLPPPDFGQAPPLAQHPAAAAGSKRAHPDTRGPLPNPMSLDSKVHRSGAAGNVGSAKPSAKSSMLLPPQLRGRANVATEDLSSMFTKSSQQAARQRSSGGGGGSTAS